MDEWSEKNGSVHLGALDDLLHKAVSDGVFPGAVALGAVAGRVLFHRAYGWANLFTRRPMDVETVFDLASLTKPLATALAVLTLADQRRIGLEQTVASILPGFGSGAKSRITIRQLLTHRSGYPAHRPYYEKASHLSAAESTILVRKWLTDEPLSNHPGAQTIYSDLGFMLLAWVVETVTKESFSGWITEHIYEKLGIGDTLFFPEIHDRKSRINYAATELCPWRKRVLEGIVHDDNAYVTGGVCGQAGLFGTAYGVWTLLWILLQDAKAESRSRLLSAPLARLLFKKDALSDRPIGMDSPAPVASSCGSRFPLTAVGHLGFTGTSFWVDPDMGRIVILLTNRVHPRRDNWKIRLFRPSFHDAMMAFLLEF